jgi:predicted anti-sigma-YlaC factor YlaD
MSAERCVREDDLLDALERAFIGAELEAHVASCASCSELRLVAGALLDDRAQAMIEAPIPSAGTMWWRMRVRRRHEAQATARRSLLIGQAATLVIALALVVSFFGTDVAFAVKNVIATIRVSTPLLLALATWVLVAPIAGWVALRQK